jgi:hypothetical protein
VFFFDIVGLEKVVLALWGLAMVYNYIAKKDKQKTFNKKSIIKKVLLQFVWKAVIFFKDDSFEGVVYKCPA